MITSSNNPTSVSPFKKENVEAILPLSETQEAFLWLREQVQPDPGALLAEAMLAGPFQRERFEEAWNCEVQRHELLRASIRKRQNHRSMLIVWKRLPQTFDFHDLSHLDATGQVSELQKLREQPAFNIDPEESPCSKIALIRLGPEKHCLWWSFHHLFFDGWSTAIVLRDVLSRYQSMLEGNQLELPVKPSIREYLNCRDSCDESESKMYWREHLAGYRGTPKFAVDSPIVQSIEKLGDVECCLGSDVSEEINRLIRVEDLTLNSIAAASWSIVLGNIVGQPDVVFATTASGRNLPIEGMHNLVGMFANVVPFKIQLNRESTTLREWLTEIRDNQFEAQSHEHRLLVEIEEWCQLEPGRDLCESLLVVENFPLKTHQESVGKLVLQDFKSGTASNYPIACYVIPGPRWKLKIEFDPRVISNKTAAEIVDQLGQMIRCLGESSFDMQVQEFVSSLQLSSFDEIKFSKGGQRLAKRLGDGQQHLQRYNETELQLTSVWENVLGVSPIGLDDGFFELGGKSMTAVRVVAKIQNMFGISLPPTVLIEHATIRQLSQIVAGGQMPPNRTLVKFNRQESGDPIVCPHVGGGYSTYYRFLASLFPEHPVVGLHPKGLEGSPPLRSFPELAAYFIEQLDQSFGSRRYHLVGYCMSAALSLEMARQLEAGNRPTPSLTIIDSGPKWVYRKFGLAEFMEWEGSRWKGAVKFAVFKTKVMLNSGKKLFEQIRDGYFRKAEGRRDYYRKRVEKVCTKAFRAYPLKPTAVPIKLIRSTEFAKSPERNFHLDWSNLTTNEFSIELVEGEHSQMLLDPCVGRVAEILRAEIDKSAD